MLRRFVYTLRYQRQTAVKNRDKKRNGYYQVLDQQQMPHIHSQLDSESIMATKKKFHVGKLKINMTDDLEGTDTKKEWGS